MRKEHTKNTPSLPTDYQRLLYIQSTGSQRIDTGVRITPDLGWLLKTQWVSYGSVDAYGCEPWSLNPNGNVIRIAARSGMGIDILYGNTKSGERSEYTSNVMPTEIKEIYVENGAQYINGSLVMSQAMTNSEPTHTIQYFCTEDSGIFKYYCTSNRHYYSVMWYGSEKIREFIPALRVSDNKPGLYDTVNNQFYTNQGTGEFLYN